MIHKLQLSPLRPKLLRTTTFTIDAVRLTADALPVFPLLTRIQPPAFSAPPAPGAVPGGVVSVLGARVHFDEFHVPVFDELGGFFAEFEEEFVVFEVFG